MVDQFSQIVGVVLTLAMVETGQEAQDRGFLDRYHHGWVVVCLLSSSPRSTSAQSRVGWWKWSDDGTMCVWP